MRTLIRFLFIYFLLFAVLVGGVGGAFFFLAEESPWCQGMTWEQVLNAQVSCEYEGPNGFWTCSGIEGSARGVPIVLTCAHCVLDGDTPVAGLSVMSYGSTVKRKSILLGYDRLADVAVLFSCNPRLTSSCDLYRALADPRPGDDCWVLGDPAGRRNIIDRTVVANLHIDIDYDGMNHPMIATYGNAWQGNSGGPVVIKRCPGHYRLIGLHACRSSGFRGQPEIRGVTKTQALRDLLDKYVPKPTND